jgi:Ca-activated chloride channel family protein
MPDPVRLGIRVALADGVVREVASSLHAVTTTMRDAQVIELGPHENLDRDFVLRWRVDGAELRSTLACVDDADGKGGTFMLTFVPPSSLALSQKPRDVVFVIDRSGSMEGWKMQAARRATARMIDTLTSRDRFQVIAFDNAIELLPDVQLGNATDRMRFKAVEELAKIGARGGTEMEQPLSLAVKTLAGGHDDRERVIVLVTDGQVGNEDQILRQVAPNLKGARVFALGIDQAVNGAFLRRLAGAGGGLCELVESEDRLDVVMGKVHRRIGTPVATELRVDAHGIDVVWSHVAPAKLPDVYAGAPVVVLGRYRGTAAADASLTVDGTSFGEPLKLRVSREATAANGSLGGRTFAISRTSTRLDRASSKVRSCASRSSGTCSRSSPHSSRSIAARS